MLKIFYTTTAFQLLFFGLVVIASKHKKQFHYWMSALLFIQSIVFILTVGRWHYNVIPDTQFFRLLKVLFEYSLSPVFYIFVVKATQQQIQLNPKKILLAIPLVIGLIFLYLPQSLWGKYWLEFHTLLTFNFYSQAILFFLLALNSYKAYEVNMKNYLTQDYFQSLKLLRLVLIWFIIILVLGLISNLIRIQFNFGATATAMNIAVETIMLLLINVFLFIGIKLPQEIINISLDENKVTNDSIERTKYKNSNLSLTDKKKIIKKLNHLVAENKYYLTPNLTIKKLGEELDVQPKHLSQVINEDFGQNFCDYINSYRIEDAIGQLKDPKQQHKTILEICYDIGFNSKSAFNDVFKKQKGLTPTTFRKSLHQKKRLHRNQN
jgi:AraC-like DNA-binding protein